VNKKEDLSKKLSKKKSNKDLIYLRALGLRTYVKPNTEFNDDGYVKSIKDQEKKLYNQYNISQRTTRAKTILGLCIPINIKRKNIYHIFYINTKNRLINTLLKAHEETHFLDWENRLNTLWDAYKKELGITINSRMIKHKNPDIRREIIADMGCIYILEKQGLELKTRSIENEKYDFQLNQAIKIYEKIKAKQKNQ